MSLEMSCGQGDYITPGGAGNLIARLYGYYARGSLMYVG